MISRAEFEAVLRREVRARDHCERILSRAQRPEVRKRIEIIRNDERRHIELAKRMMELISGGSCGDRLFKEHAIGISPSSR